jgi:hypothetical protein
VEATGQSPSKIDENLVFDSLFLFWAGSRKFTFIPKYTKYFDSFKVPDLKEKEFEKVPELNIPVKRVKLFKNPFRGRKWLRRFLSRIRSTKPKGYLPISFRFCCIGLRLCMIVLANLILSISSLLISLVIVFQMVRLGSIKRCILLQVHPVWFYLMESALLILSVNFFLGFLYYLSEVFFYAV